MTGLDSARLTFHGLLSPWVAGAIALVAAVAVFVLYAREHGKIGPVRRVFMAILRVAVVGTALFLLCRPVLLAETKGERTRGVAVLLDDSLSMTQQDQRISVADRFRVAIAENRVPPDAQVTEQLAAGDVPAATTENPSRASLVRAVLAHPRLQLLENLERRAPVQIYLFGQRLRRVEEEPPDPERKKPAEPAAARAVKALKNAERRTALSDAINDVLARSEGDLPAAIVVATDGQDNASKITLSEAARECERLGVPLHLWGVGSSEVGNLTLKDFASPETIFYDDTVSVPIRWRCRGFRQGAAEITLSLGGRVVARKEVALSEGEDFREVLRFTPKKDGGAEVKTDLIVAVRYKGTETLTEDNELRRPVSIVDRKVKILYAENAPRWEYKFLQPALLRDRRVEARFVLAAGDKRTLTSGPPYLPVFPATRAELFAFDVLILGDVPAAFLGAEKIGWVRDFVREGGSLIVIAGRQNTPSGYAASALAEVLPIEVPAGKPSAPESDRPQSYVPVLTRQGERAEMMALADTPEDNARVWQTLPGFYGFTPGARLRPGAVALLVHPRLKVNEQPLPILATHYYGKGQVFFLATDETWRWRSNVENKYFGRFWGQVIYQMGLPHLIGTPKRVQLSLERPENFLGRPGHVYARAFDAEFRPYAGERLTARLEPIDAKPGEGRARSLSLEPVAGQPGEYRALLAHDALGRFALKVDEPASAGLEFRVDLPPQHELEVAGMDEALLREAAAASGGKFYREEDLHRLVANLAPRKAAVTSRHEVLLWNAPMLILFVALVLAEWVLRKFSNLS